MTEDSKSMQVKPSRQSARNWIRVIGTLEGLSFLLLLFIAMPLKYMGNNPLGVEILGPIHGGLFLFYVASALVAVRLLSWHWTRVLLAFIASVMPFGPFVFEAWLQRQYALEDS